MWSCENVSNESFKITAYKEGHSCYVIPSVNQSVLWVDLVTCVVTGGFIQQQSYFFGNTSHSLFERIAASSSLPPKEIKK